MANAWTPNGPVSSPPRALAYFAGFVLVVLAVAGVGLGLRAAWRQAGAPSIGGGVAEASSDDDTLTAKPIVDLPPPVAPPEAAKDADNAVNNADEDSKADAIAAKTAAAQAIQSKPAKPGGDIDDILASTSEKPPSAAKPSADEAPPPGPPVKSDVPF
jgi:hypothetical protein